MNKRRYKKRVNIKFFFYNIDDHLSKKDKDDHDFSTKPKHKKGQIAQFGLALRSEIKQEKIRIINDV